MKFGSSCSSEAKRKRSILLYTVASLAAVVLATGCTPDPVSRIYSEPKRDFGPQRKDDRKDIGEIAANAAPSPDVFNFSGTVSTASWYRSIDDLSLLARMTDEESLGHLSYKMAAALTEGAVPWKHLIAKSAYTSAAIGETKQDTDKAVADGIAMLAEQEPIFQGIVDRQHSLIVWPSQPTDLETLIELVQRYLAGVTAEIETSALEPAVRDRILQEIRITFNPILFRFKIQVHLAYKESKTYDFIGRLRKAVEAEKIKIGKSTLERLIVAEKLTRDVEKMKTSRDALRVLVDFWKASSEEIRLTKFKPVSPALYDYLDGKSDSDLNCIRSNCGFITRIAKALFILPAIEKFGVKRLREELITSARAAIFSEVETTATDVVRDLNTLIAEQVFIELRRQSDNLKTISADYAAYIRLVFGRMSLAKFGLNEDETFAGFDPSEIKVSLNFGEHSEVRAHRIDEEHFESGAEAIGAGLAVALDQHDNHVERELLARGLHPIVVHQNLQKLFFEQLNKMLMVGGFKTEAETPFDSLALSLDLDKPRFRRLNLRTLMDSPLSFAVPDQILISEPENAEQVLSSISTVPVRVSVGAQAEMLRGLSRLIIRLRDWGRTSFDTGLGRVNLADFVPDLPREAVDRSLFPKDLMFAAAIGNASALLQNITKKVSAVGLIDPDKKLRWANEPEPLMDDTSKRATMAAVFNLVDEERSLVTRSGDVARFLSAMVEFLRATEGIENTQSPPLREVAANGKSPVDLLVAARTDLKMLVMAMANFLSNEMIDSDGVIRPEYDRSDAVRGPVAVGDPKLLDQALVLRALLDAADATSALVYRNIAIDLMAAVNTVFYRPSLAFYSALAHSTARADFESTVAVLVAGERLAPYVEPERQQRWKKVARPWVGALREAARSLP